MFNKKGIEANVILLIVVTLGLFIITGVFALVYGVLGAVEDDLKLNAYSSAEIRTLDNELYATLFGSNNLADIIIQGEVLDRKTNIDSEIEKILARYKDNKDKRLYSLVINYKDKPLVYGEDLSPDFYPGKIESSLRLPSLKNDFIEVKLISAFPTSFHYYMYYGVNYG